MNPDSIATLPTMNLPASATTPQRQSRYGLMDWTLALEREFLRVMHTNMPAPPQAVDAPKSAARASVPFSVSATAEHTVGDTVPAGKTDQSPATTSIAEESGQSRTALPQSQVPDPASAFTASTSSAAAQPAPPFMAAHMPMNEGTPQIAAYVKDHSTVGTRPTPDANRSDISMPSPMPLRNTQTFMQAQASGQLNETTRNAFALGADTASAPSGTRQVHVESGPDGFTLWIRDAALAVNDALPLAQGMAREFVGRGLRIAAINVNGERVLSITRPHSHTIPEADEPGQITSLNYYF